MGVPLHFLLVPSTRPPALQNPPKIHGLIFFSAMLDINICNHLVIIYDHDLEFESDWMVETTCRVARARKQFR